MAIQLPQNRLAVRQTQPTKRAVPLEQIIQAQGQSPVAEGVQELGNVIGQTLQKRAALQQQGKQLAALAQMSGEQAPPPDSGITPELYEKGIALQNARKDKVSAAAEKKIALEMKLEQLKSGSTVFDPTSGKSTTYPGVQGLSIQYDNEGNPFMSRDPNYKPKEVPKPLPVGGGSGSSFKNEADLRKEFEKESLDSKKAFQASSKALSLANRGDSIGDTALAFALTKGAIGGAGRITQTEIQQFGPKLGSYPDRVQNAILGLVNGKKYDADVRAQIIDMVKQQAALDDQTQTEREQRYTGIANNYKFNPKNVVYDVRPPDLRTVLNPAQSGGLQPIQSPAAATGPQPILSPTAQKLVAKHR